MKLVSCFKSLLTKTSFTPYKLCEKTIRRLGYKMEDEGTFIREDLSGRTMIWLSEKGVKIKVYAHGYAETDYLPAPLPDAETLKSFIRRNEL